MRQVQTHVLVLDILGLLLRYRRYLRYGDDPELGLVVVVKVLIVDDFHKGLFLPYVLVSNELGAASAQCSCGS